MFDDLAKQGWDTLLALHGETVAIQAQDRCFAVCGVFTNEPVTAEFEQRYSSPQRTHNPRFTYYPKPEKKIKPEDILLIRGEKYKVRESQDDGHGACVLDLQVVA